MARVWWLGIVLVGVVGTPLFACSGRAGEPDAGDVEVLDVGADAIVVEVDGGRPLEMCNLADDDMDMRVDEAPACAESLAHGVCVEGRCVCHDLRVPAREGDFGDCNGDVADGCETRLDVRSDCGGCGVQCAPTEGCVDAGGGFGCRTTGILDLSVADEGGQITCIVTDDNRVVCRGDNASHALSDELDETAVLDWTELEIPFGREVHASRIDHGDGTSGLSVCVVTVGGEVLCRGDNTTGLLGQGHTRALRGTWPIAIVDPVIHLEVWNGEGVATSRVRADRAHAWRWGARGWARAPEQLSGDASPLPFSIDYMSSVRLALPDTWSFRSHMWGVHRSFLAGLPDDAPPWSEPTTVAHGGTCRGGVCCNAQRCWGGRPYDESRGRISLPPSIDDPHGTHVETRPARDCQTPYFEYEHFTVALLDDEADNDVFISPDAEGRQRVCVRGCYEHVENFYPGGPHFRIACGDVETVLAAETTVLEIVPEMTIEDERYARSRVDWQAMCVQHRPDWWECWGSHTGWNNPPAE